MWWRHRLVRAKSASALAMAAHAAALSTTSKGSARVNKSHLESIYQCEVVRCTGSRCETAEGILRLLLHPGEEIYSPRTG